MLKSVTTVRVELTVAVGVTVSYTFVLALAVKEVWREDPVIYRDRG